MCGNFALWYVICFRRGDQWSPFLVHSIISVLFFVGAVPTMSIFLELFHMTVFWIKPPLRFSGTSPQGEAFSAPIEGSCRQSRLRGGEEKRRAVAEYSRRGDHWSPVWIVFFLFLHRIEKIGKI